MDESELKQCIRNLIRMASRGEEDSDHERSAGNDEEDGDYLESKEYQDLVEQVESKLTEFLEVQVTLQENNGSSEKAIADESHGVLPIHQAHAYPCSDTSKILPSLPKDWPQRPVMIRPTPGSTTTIRGIRYASDRDYKHFSGFCAGCILPINNGTEAEGRSLVVDFESSHFVGTLLMRMRDTQPAEKDSSNEASDNNNSSYFDKRKRRFQGIVKGKFKQDLPMSECVTGQDFSRRAGKMPAKWVVSAFIKFVSTLAPQLETTIDGDNPRFLVPLVATAHTVQAKPHATIVTNELKNKVDASLFNCSVYLGSTDIEAEVQEPPAIDETSVMQDVHRDLGVSVSTGKTSVSSRMKARKKAYNAVSAKKSGQPCFSLDKEYTFEFYQHLMIFHEDEFVLDMGIPIGKVPLSPITDGQPIKFMSAHKHPVTGLLDSLWSFDIWHESMYPIAQKVMEHNT